MSHLNFLTRLLPAFFLAAPWALATSVIPPSFHELVSQADLVVDGEITSVRSEFAAHEGGRLVYTYVTVEVLEVIKGAAGPLLELRLLGGTVGDFSMTIDGVPQFRRGDRDILFIVGNGDQFCPLVAVMHGRYPIVSRAGDGADIVLRTNGAPLRAPEEVQLPLSSVSLGILSRGGNPVSAAMTVAQFKSRIREEVSGVSAK